MGYDPSTHQVWVKIVGLPLQAWTTMEITQILQKFGYPLQILPFGRAAGHYRDITALVATKDPSRIPLAYVYREGDYSARVDIFILSWRLWEEGYFPPPGQPPFPDGPQHQPQQGTGPVIRVPRSPSSSSSANNPTEEMTEKKDDKHALFLPNPTMFQLALCLRERFGLPSPSHDCNHNIATGNPTTTSDTQQTYILMHLFLLTVPRPITINPFPFFLTATAPTRTLGGAQSVTRLALNTLPLYLGKEIALNAPLPGNKSISLLQRMLEEYYKEYSITARSPLKPTTEIRPENFSPHPQAHSMKLPHSPPEAHDHTTKPVAPTLSPRSPDLFSDRSIVHIEGENMFSLTDRTEPLDPPGFVGSLSDLAGIADPQQQGQIEKTPSTLSTGKDTHMSLSVSQKSSSESPSPIQMAKRKAKGKQPATRRSQRLQEKLQVTCVSTKPVTEPKSKVAKISFDLHPHRTPLELNTALTILQASGLQINQKIEDMIEEAVKKDSANDQTQDSRPLTPLHDAIPPLTMPGDNIAL